MTKRGDDEQKLSEAEVKRVLSIAMAPAKKRDTGSLSLDDLKAGAGELGVPTEKLDAAFHQMREEQARERASGKRAVRIVIPLLIAGFVVATCTTTSVYMFTSKKPGAEPVSIWFLKLNTPPPATTTAPPAFTGKMHVTVTSRVDENSHPVDALPRIAIASQRRFEIYASMSGVTHEHVMRCDLVDAAGTLVDSDQVKLSAPGEPHYVWFKFTVPFTRKPGTYTARIFADGAVVAEQPVEHVIGNVALTLAPDVKNGDAVGARNEYTRKKDKAVYAHFHLDNARGSGANIHFDWRAPDGTSKRKHTIALQEANGPWAVWDTLVDVKALATGTWTVRVTFEDTLAAESSFTVK